MKKMRKILRNSLLFIVCLVQCVAVFGATPYRTFTRDSYGNYVETQTAYTPVGTLTKVGDLEFSNASDMLVGKNGNIYICDTGNKRVLVSDSQGELVRVIGDELFGSPLGIFLTEDYTLYVADEQKERVFVFDEAGTDSLP